MLPCSLDWEKVQLSNIESEGWTFKLATGFKSKRWDQYASLLNYKKAFDNKIATMLGENLAYIIDKNTEEAVIIQEIHHQRCQVLLSQLMHTPQERDQKNGEADYTVGKPMF